MMAAFIIQNRIDSINKLKQFNVEGYKYSEAESTPLKLVFLRKKRA